MFVDKKFGGRLTSFFMQISSGETRLTMYNNAALPWINCLKLILPFTIFKLFLNHICNRVKFHSLFL